MPRVLCAKCGGEDIREKNVAFALITIFAWTVEADGLPQPADYDTSEDADWECQDTEYQYVCRACGREHRLDQLIVEEDADVTR